MGPRFHHMAVVILLVAGLGLGPKKPDVKVAPATVLEKVGYDQKLGAQVPLDLTFHDETGATVRLGDLVRGKRPVILTLVYFNCPMLCNQVLNGLTRSMKALTLDMGTDFDVVTVSFDPKEKPDLAAAKKQNYVRTYGRPTAEAGWHFLTGDEANIAQLTRSVGFRYTYNPATGLYAHAAGITVLTPDGRVARYLFGIDYPARDVQFALMQASKGRIGSPIARLLMLCYDYDAATGKYTLAIMRITQALGAATVVALGLGIGFMVYRERRRNPLSSATPTPPIG